MSPKRIATGAVVCSAVLFVSACGGGAPTTAGATSAPSAPTTTSSGSDGGTAGRARSFPGATGMLAQIDGTTLQVQGTDTQTSVTYSPVTRFTSTVPAQRSKLLVGDCVQARSARLVAGPGGSAPSAAPSADTGPIVAASVEISPASNGSCTAFGGLRAGGRPQGAGGGATPPAGAPTRGPRSGGEGFAGFGAFGKVTAVSAAGFTLESSRPGGSATPAAPTTRAVQTTATTTYTRTAASTAKALVVGLCVTALGKASDTGSIAATSISLRPALNGSCSTGFDGRGPAVAGTPGGASGA